MLGAPRNLKWRVASTSKAQPALRARNSGANGEATSYNKSAGVGYLHENIWAHGNRCERGAHGGGGHQKASLQR